MTPLYGWENFYVIVGSSAGALMGLQFVVIALIAEMPMARGGEPAALFRHRVWSISESYCSCRR